ncbi:hypothetical protein N8K70_14810 [Microbacterium betulae]|uniref:Uncharacterized protein n=1 Tax=Microbacterium betulae TaxID=2981139 RepID=A0AA97I615_9MICO|nr:hypothetical protein [Microbacterium sp. AB]WOF22647.1 hypothetical protein N8K70_14810 [Microbacterium sp. AB]
MSDTEGVESGDAELFAALRDMWRHEDPVPASLTERMIAAVAVEDLSRDFELLALVAEADPSSVRADPEHQTLQFSNDVAHVLLHIAATKSGTRRVDGWSDPPVLAARCAQEAREWSAETAGDGRFTFDDVKPGPSQVRMVVRRDDGAREFATPWFEV